MTDAFIPNEVAVAPNPFGLAPNLKLVTIPVDAYTSFELWLPKPNATLLPEEAMLLVGDRPRLEEICASLTWLLGASPIGQDDHDDPIPTHDWRVVQRWVHQVGGQFDGIGVNYQPQTLYPSVTDEGAATAWTLKPFTWNISFFDLNPLGSKYQVEARSIGLFITYGHAITKPTQITIAGINQL